MGWLKFETLSRMLHHDLSSQMTLSLNIIILFPLCPFRYAGALRGRHRRRPEAVGERVQPRHHQVARLHHHLPLQNLRWNTYIGEDRRGARARARSLAHATPRDGVSAVQWWCRCNDGRHLGRVGSRSNSIHRGRDRRVVAVTHFMKSSSSSSVHLSVCLSFLLSVGRSASALLAKDPSYVLISSLPPFLGPSLPPSPSSKCRHHPLCAASAPRPILCRARAFLRSFASCLMSLLPLLNYSTHYAMQ